MSNFVAFVEDKTILSMIQQEKDKDEEGTKRVGMKLDASAGLFRHMVNQRIEDEAVPA